MRGQPIRYKPEELAWIEARKDWPRAELHVAFCNFWNRSEVTKANIIALCKRKGWLTGRTGCFTKGQTPHNKGKPMPPEVRAKCLKTAFKPGNRPHTWRGAGHERIDEKDGYVVMIVDEVNPWTGAPTRPVLKHRYLWEQKNGPLPDGYCLKCLDGDKTNTDPSNWEAIPRALLPRLNGRWKKGYDDYEPELRPTVLNIAKLEHRARSARKDRQ